jgi:hypothetical protein
MQILNGLVIRVGFNEPTNNLAHLLCSITNFIILGCSADQALETRDGIIRIDLLTLGSIILIEKRFNVKL